MTENKVTTTKIGQQGLFCQSLSVEVENLKFVFRGNNNAYVQNINIYSILIILRIYIIIIYNKMYGINIWKLFFSKNLKFREYSFFFYIVFFIEELKKNIKYGSTVSLA